MLAKTFLALIASATTAVASTDALHFLYATDSYSGIQNSGHGYSSGFTISDDDGNTLYNSANPDGYSPCMSNSNKIQITSDCFSGTWTFGCQSKFDGSPDLCSAYNPDGTPFPGESNEDLTYIGISAGIEGTCSGDFTITGNTCTSDSTFTIVKRYRGDYQDV